MNGLLSLFLAGATLAGAVEDQAPKPKIDVSAQIYMPDGKASGASRRIELGTEPLVLYVYTGKTLCEARTVSTEKPVVAGNGWKVTLLPFKSVEIIGVKSAVPKGAVEMKATWQRLWEGGKELPTGPAKSSTITLSPGNSVPLDTIDGGSRRAAREIVAQLSKWVHGAPIPDEVKRDSEIDRLSSKIDMLNKTIQVMKTEQGLGEGHPKIVDLRRAIAESDVQLTMRMRTLADAAAQNPSLIPVSTTVIDGCAALSMNLEVGAPASTAVALLTEIELWLIHRDPAGKETEQRQVVRSRSSNGEFYFDDINIATDRGPVTVEVFGSVGAPSLDSVGQPWLRLQIGRRYVTSAPTLGWKTKEGHTDYAQSVARDEVVSFQMPPLPNDDGALVGHRFSLRVRVKVLQ